MPIYDVTLEVSGYCMVTVEAEDEDAARDNAREAYDKYEFEADLIDVGEVHELSEDEAADRG